MVELRRIGYVGDVESQGCGLALKGRDMPGLGEAGEELVDRIGCRR